MKFDLSEDQRALQNTVREYCETRFPMRRVRSVVDSGSGGNDEVWQGLMDLGIGAMLTTAEYGGLGLGVLDAAAVMEMIGYASTPAPIFGQLLGILAVAHGGSDEQRCRWSQDFATGRRRVGVAFDSAAAVLDAAGADVLIVPADGGLALVEVNDGVTIEKLSGIDRTRTLSRVHLNSAALQPLPGGARILDWLHAVAHTLLAADAVGGATRCLDMTVDYVSVREQGGVAVGSYQAVKHQLADLALHVEPSRGLYWYAAHLLDRDSPSAGTDAVRAACLAKSHATERYVEAGRESVRLHGGLGYTWECDVHVFLKRALVDREYLGDPHRLYARVADLNGW